MSSLFRVVASREWYDDRCWHRGWKNGTETINGTAGNAEIAARKAKRLLRRQGCRRIHIANVECLGAREF